MGRTRKSLSVAVVIVVALLSAQSVSADPKTEQAKQHFSQAQAYFKAGTFDKAIVEYTAAFDLSARSALLFNIGLCHENAGNMEEALVFYDRYLVIAGSESKADEARARREALQRAIKRRAADAEKSQQAAAKRAEGNRALGASSWAEAIVALKESYALVADPEVIFELAEAYRQKGEPILAKLEYERYLGLAVDGSRREDAGRRIQEISDAEREALITSSPPRNAAKHRSRGSLIPGIVAFSAAGVAGATGIFFGLKASNLGTEIDDELAIGIPPFDNGDPRIEEGKSAALTANISYGVAGLATALGGYLLYRAFRGEMVPVEPRSATLVPTAGAKHAGFAVEVTF